VTDLASIPFDVPDRRSRVAEAWRDAKAALDLVAHNVPRAHRWLVRLNPYPRPWRAVTLRMPDGARLAGWHGRGRAGAPAVLMLPGTFQTKDDTPRKRRALSLWRRFGAHVLIIDQRGFGGSAAERGTGGNVEAGDALVAAAWLARESGRARVVLWGESLGGAIALLAATRPGAEDVVERVVAWSPFADLGDAALATAGDDPRGRTMLGRTYRWLLRHRDRRVHDFREFLQLRAAELGTTVEALLDEGSPARHVARLRVPAVVFHAEDDPVVPVDHARRLADLRAPLLAVHVLPRGRHLAFDRVAPRWYAAVTERLLTIDRSA
jgi:alpha-beta hydrolase superfamily lysophospholipase